MADEIPKTIWERAVKPMSAYAIVCMLVIWMYRDNRDDIRNERSMLREDRLNAIKHGDTAVLTLAATTEANTRRIEAAVGDQGRNTKAALDELTRQNDLHLRELIDLHRRAMGMEPKQAPIGVLPLPRPAEETP
jgi:hypothetical protein